mmetsp:Transcript_18354/g.52567  ORF Transcript_18354/g.52567 Transcript_18354/m.52567 type:complete len:411 (+) Transcript_18354:84-1316(+)
MATSSSSWASSSRTAAGRRTIGGRTSSAGGATATSSYSSATLLAPVVIEFGSSYLRIGISGEAAPRHIVPTPAPLGALPQITALKNEAEWDGCLYPLLSHISTNLLLLKSLKSRPVIIVEPFVSPTAFQNAICKSLLGWLGAPSVTFVPGAAAVALPYGLALGHGIVVDVGRAEGRVTVVAGESGHPLLDTFRVSPCGIEQLAQNFMDVMNDSPSKSFEIASVSDAIAILHDSLLNGKEVNTATDEEIHIDPEAVNSCLHETYFDFANPESLLRCFLASLSSCPIDFRKEAVRNVCCIGGTVEFIPNFERKFLNALADVFTGPTDEDESSLAFRSLRPLLDKKEGCLGIVYPLPFSPGIFAWTAASVFGSTGALPIEQTVHKQAFLSSQSNDSARSKEVVRDFLLNSATQ